MATHRATCGTVVKFSIKIKDNLNINRSKFGTSTPNPVVPPTFQICAFVYAKKKLNHKEIATNLTQHTAMGMRISLHNASEY